jgi:hypothetical protein
VHPSFRKAVVALLCAVIVLGGSGFSGVFAAAIQHDLGVEHSLDGSLPDSDGRNGGCTHGCAAHLCVHLLAVTQAVQPSLLVKATAERGARVLIPAPPFLTDSFFRPPRVFLA